MVRRMSDVRVKDRVPSRVDRETPGIYVWCDCAMNCRELYDWEYSRQAAQDNYKATSSQMHPVTSAMVAKDLHLV